MERLTKRLSSGAPTYNYPASCYFDDDSGPDKIAQSAFRQRCVERLADYEDTECDPEEVSTLVKDWVNLCTIVGECGGISRVVELAEADKDGRMVVLPCKVGDTVWRIKRTFEEYPDRSKPYIEPSGFLLQDVFNISKTVFLTREEAESALEAMKDV